ncbi:hypothetical protein ETB97_006650 [Aspergillus alliaceus]|uniref:Erythromycin biosynthesis protein CIII-like C-terminal domain-containing protein n=1 Tax=Petromyces alliaceus TaxID=209559 RepID=A0A8H6E374_PETAA|nr:hypothetical protein ETB97_006650 [Aspergillus burnettii]
MTRSTILFLTFSELGQATLPLAVAHEFIIRSSYDVHIGSFAQLEPAVSHLNARAATLAPATNTATFHPITGTPMVQTLSALNMATESFRTHDIGFQGALRAFKNIFPSLTAPWDGPQYLEIYQDCVTLIQTVQPAIVVLDPIFLQAVEACRMLGQRYVALSPNTFKELLVQPRLAGLWKYPVICSGYPYPLPWYLILPNAYLALQMFSVTSNNPRARELQAYRNVHGLPGPTPSQALHQFNETDKTVALLPARREIEFPCYFPDNFTLCGPILRPCAPIAKEDPELASWLERRPTVLVNLGSHVMYMVDDLRELMDGFRILLDKRPDIQILWKIKRSGGTVAEETILPDNLRTAIAEGRVRVEPWLEAEPICILLSGHVQCMVHHGGSNSFHEAIQAGVPQVILPLWFDTYDFAWRAEWLGIGVWGSRKTAPAVNGPELGRALIRVLVSAHSAAMKDRAKNIASQLGPKEGRVIAYEKIVSLLAEPL